MSLRRPAGALEAIPVNNLIPPFEGDFTLRILYNADKFPRRLMEFLWRTGVDPE
jgi:hypothetical protein